METHSLATLKTGSHLSGKASLSFGYLNEKEDYVLMVKRDDGGYRRRCYSADSAVVYEDADADGARVDTVTRYSVIRCTYMFPLPAGGCATCISSLGRRCAYMFPRDASNRAGTISHSLPTA